MGLALLLSWTTPPVKLFRALRRSLAPAYVAFVLMTAWRYTIVLLHSLADLMQARIGRQLVRLDARRERELSGSGAGRLYLRSMRLARDLGEAMTSRGFTGDV